jgi:hypothetical protein
VGGAILILVAMFVAGPIGVFAAGAIWSMVNGWLLSEDADARAEAPDLAAG